jgi:hypothetical protein
MNWLNEQYANERYQEALREAVHDAEISTLLDNAPMHSETRRLRQSVGGKLIEWRRVVARYVSGQHRVRPLVEGKRLQETPNAPQTLKST